MLHMQGNPICIWNTRIKHLEHAAWAVDAVDPKEKQHQNPNHLRDQQSRLNLTSQGGGNNMKTLITSIKSQMGGVVSVLLAFLIPIHGLILAVGMAIVADTIIGVYKTVKFKGWKEVSSRKLSSIVSKMFLYQGALILFYCIDKMIMGEFVALFIGIPLFLTKILSAVLCFIELKSIDENYKIISGYSIWERFKGMLARAKELKEDFSEIKKDGEPN